MDTYSYEVMLLHTFNQLLQGDLAASVTVLLSRRNAALSPSASTFPSSPIFFPTKASGENSEKPGNTVSAIGRCLICEQSLLPISSPFDSLTTLILFRCGHVFHAASGSEKSGETGSSNGCASGSKGCPVCSGDFFAAKTEVAPKEAQQQPSTRQIDQKQQSQQQQQQPQTDAKDAEEGVGRYLRRLRRHHAAIKRAGNSSSALWAAVGAGKVTEALATDAGGSGALLQLSPPRIDTDLMIASDVGDAGEGPSVRPSQTQASSSSSRNNKITTRFGENALVNMSLTSGTGAGGNSNEELKKLLSRALPRKLG